MHKGFFCVLAGFGVKNEIQRKILEVIKTRPERIFRSGRIVLKFLSGILGGPLVVNGIGMATPDPIQWVMHGWRRKERNHFLWVGNLCTTGPPKSEYQPLD